MDNSRDEQHKDFLIRVNQVPDAQFDFGDIGWAYQVYRDTTLIFRLVVKTTGGRQTDETDRMSVFDWGRQKVISMIEAGSFAIGDDYCWQWARLLGEPPEPIPCEGFIRNG